MQHMSHQQRLEAQEALRRTELTEQLSALLKTTPKPHAIGDAVKAAKRASAAIAKNKPSLRVLQDALSDLRQFHRTGD